MKIIDMHSHIFPDKIADRAAASIGEFYGLHMDCDASVNTLLKEEAKIEARKVLVCSSALAPKQVESINNFLSESLNAHPDKFVVFGAMHRDYDNYKEEIQRVKELGFTGIKFHHDMQKIDIDDPKQMPIYKEIAKNGLAVLFHMGDDRYDYSAPARMVKVAREIPELTIFAAHFGGYQRWADSIHNPKLDNVYYDTSSSLFAIDKSTAKRFIDYFGPDRFFFGSDFPMWTPESELKRFLNLGLGDEVNKMILHDNAARVLGLKD